ncbi:DUF2683 family protein [Candidatus Woesearchaeota archaeon]|jgi:hypothetical protein|nr:DUF2683 family protein [Candidatus Woesearchaeota archaeon]MBT3438634.1 DUF2683 family protein [Candidatus Woesearchaeota archaeon]MBT4730976.1 DUF2683 family protein [Candidatus Woesearchaeota archaeon]MBT5558008.1 DUF2683 family protein [Candidatus Woesearchaeota archaeon]MBT7555968.1 DUF2683 family protein [Candidatus Woesearchaeota archaeon]
MVQALLEINENSNRVLNVVKAKYNLKDKSEAVEWIISDYISSEPELKPGFVKKIEKMKKEKNIKVENFAKRYGL